jgi:hypothetical protein
MDDGLKRKLLKMVNAELVSQTDDFIHQLDLSPEESTFVRAQMKKIDLNQMRDEFLAARKRYGNEKMRTTTFPAIFAVLTKLAETWAKLADATLFDDESRPRPR